MSKLGDRARSSWRSSREGTVRTVRWIGGGITGAGSLAGILTGVRTLREAFTMDVAIPGLLHLKVVRSEHAHARINAVHTEDALAVPGVVTILTWEDSPMRRFTSAIHESHLVEPEDTLVLDRVARFLGQRLVDATVNQFGGDSRRIVQLACEFSHE